MEKRIEQLTDKERRLLRIRAIVVALFGLGIGGITIYMLFFVGAVRSLGFPVYLFAVFFFGILGFILFVHIRNSFQHAKSVYTGIIKDKREHTMTSRKEIGQTTYSVQLDDRTFSVDHAIYNKLHRGDLVELYGLKGTVIFDAKILRPASEQLIEHKEPATILPDASVELAVSTKHILLKAVVKTALIRLLLFGLIAYVLIFVLDILLILNIQDKTQLPWMLKIIFYGILALWGLVNLTTFRLIADYFTGKTKQITEVVLDLQSGNLPKPSLNSVRTYQGFYYRNDLFYYARTEKHWLEISKELYESVRTGEQLLLTCAYYSGTILRVEKSTSALI